MRRSSLENILRGIDSQEHRWLLDDLDLPGTTGLVRFEQLNPYSPDRGKIIVKACGLMHSYATLEIAWKAPPGWSKNSQLTPVAYYAHDGHDVQDTGQSRPAYAAASTAE